MPANIIANWGRGYGGAGGGPGLARTAARLATIRRAQAQGIDVLGYVWTDYANNAAGHPATSSMTPAPLSAAENEAMQWYRWYGVKGIFFAWVHRYPARRFANVLHLPASQASSLSAALALARADNAGHVYVADQQNYSALPAYWNAENAEATAACGRAEHRQGRAWNGRRAARGAASGAARTAGTGCCRRTG